MRGVVTIPCVPVCVFRERGMHVRYTLGTRADGENIGWYSRRYCSCLAILGGQNMIEPPPPPEWLQPRGVAGSGNNSSSTLRITAAVLPPKNTVVVTSKMTKTKITCSPPLKIDPGARLGGWGGSDALLGVLLGGNYKHNIGQNSRFPELILMILLAPLG